VLDGLRLDQQCAPGLDLLARRLGLGRLALTSRAVEDVACGLESRPEGVVGLLAGAPGGLPLIEQLAVGGDAVLALRREGLRLLDEPRLALAHRLVGLVELRVELTAGL